MSTSIIAEVGLNHMGRPLYLIKYLHQLCLMADKLDAVTVQVREPAFYAQGETERSLKLVGAAYEQLAKGLRTFNLDFGVALCDIGMLEFFESIGADFYKVLSKDLKNYELILALAKTGKPVWVSTGMADEDEICDMLRAVRPEGDLRLIHTQLSYNDADTNLRAIERLRVLFGVPVGFGLHATDPSALLVSLAFDPDAVFIYVKGDGETTHRDERHAVSLAEFPALTDQICRTEKMLGNGVKKKMSNTIPDQQ